MPCVKTADVEPDRAQQARAWRTPSAARTRDSAAASARRAARRPASRSRRTAARRRARARRWPCRRDVTPRSSPSGAVDAIRRRLGAVLGRQPVAACDGPSGRAAGRPARPASGSRGTDRATDRARRIAAGPDRATPRTRRTPSSCRRTAGRGPRRREMSAPPRARFRESRRGHTSRWRSPSGRADRPAPRRAPISTAADRRQSAALQSGYASRRA